MAQKRPPMIAATRIAGGGCAIHSYCLAAVVVAWRPRSRAVGFVCFLELPAGAGEAVPVVAVSVALDREQLAEDNMAGSCRVDMALPAHWLHLPHQRRSLARRFLRYSY